MTDLIRQHKEVQQQIVEAQQRAAKLQLVADLEQRQAHFEACLSAGEGCSCNTLHSLHSLVQAQAPCHGTQFGLSSVSAGDDRPHVQPSIQGKFS